MKYTLALVAILAAALAATIVVEASAIKAEPRTSLSVGFVTTGDLLLHRGYVYSAPNTVQKDNVTVTWSSNATISAIYATEVGPAETATAWISSGGLGKSHVTVTFHSYGTLGYNYLLDIYGQ